MFRHPESHLLVADSLPAALQVSKAKPEVVFAWDVRSMTGTEFSTIDAAQIAGLVT